MSNLVEPGVHPQEIMPSQQVAALTALKIIDENMGQLEEKEFDSPLFTIIGPAGTGKSTTLMAILACFFNSTEQTAGRVINLYGHMNTGRHQRDFSSLLMHAANHLRIWQEFCSLLKQITL